MHTCYRPKHDLLSFKREEIGVIWGRGSVEGGEVSNYSLVVVIRSWRQNREEFLKIRRVEVPILWRLSFLPKRKRLLLRRRRRHQRRRYPAVPPLRRRTTAVPLFHFNSAAHRANYTTIRYIFFFCVLLWSL